MANCGFGLTIKDIRDLAFEMAERLYKSANFNQEKREAGYELYAGFMRRHPQLSLRKPEGLSAVRATMLNRNVVFAYFSMLSDKLDSLNIRDRAALLFNVDGTGINTVHQPSKVVGLKGKRAILSKTSADRGENVTAVVCVSAAGLYIPPMVIFKGQRLNLNKGLVSNGPPGTLFATSKSSFVERELFENWFKHFIRHVPSTRPVLLVLDGHASHIGLATLLLAKENNIICLPPHTTSELQPLDKCLFKPLKTEYSKACVQFLKENPGRVVTRYDFCSLFKTSYMKVCNISNAMSAFRTTGICPLNPGAISPDVFIPSTTSEIVCEEEGRCKHGNCCSSSTITNAVMNPSGDSACLKDHFASGIQSSVDRENITSTQPGCNFGDLFKIPKAYKCLGNCDERKTKKNLTARCLIENEFIRQLEEKEKETHRKLKDKEKRQKEKENRKAEKEKLTKGKRNLKKKAAKTNDRENAENFCSYCGGFYFDETSDDEDCTKDGCNSWYHESYTRVIRWGLASFECSNH